MIGELLGAVASFGVNSLMTNAVKAITPNTATKLAKVGTAVGVWAVSGVIGLVVEDEVNTKVDDFKQKVEEKKQEMLEEQELVVIEGGG